MQGTEIEISSRVLVRLLSGDIGQEEFLKVHGFDSHNSFSVMTGEGRMIREILIRPMPESDDDWIVFRFGDRDPAISPFVKPL